MKKIWDLQPTGIYYAAKRFIVLPLTLMESVIELTIDSADGAVDCRLESDGDNNELFSAIILYPHHTNGIAMSKVYEHELILDTQENVYYFGDNTPIHPSIKHLEQQLSDAILKSGK